MVVAMVVYKMTLYKAGVQSRCTKWYKVVQSGKIQLWWSSSSGCFLLMILIDHREEDRRQEERQRSVK